MGARAVRITAADFLIAPEFRHLRLAEKSTAQIGGARFSLVESGGRTRVGPCFQQVPLRVSRSFAFRDEPASLVYLINPTTGLMDGDGHLVEIDAQPGTTAVVTSQAATRIHPALSSFSTHQWRVRAGEGARLVALPGPNIPFQGSRCYQHARFDLARDAQVIWGDVWTPGRYARGELSELYQFDRIIQMLEVRREGRLVFRDRCDWKGPWDSATARWFVGDHPAGSVASLFVTGPVDLPPTQPGGLFERVVLPLAHGDTVIRWSGPTQQVIADFTQIALTIPAAWTRPSDRCEARPWLIAGNHLVPNHWFSSPRS
jgi:urease accessory protein